MITTWHKVSVTHVAKVVREKGCWEGMISQCNVNPWHLDHGWNLGLFLTLQASEGSNPLDEIKSIKRTFEYWNNDSELGRRSSLWERV